jgi:RNA polymerase subunit RPABC4/transcription elongation factor Spt4
MKKKECPACAMNIDINKNVCPVCGYEFPKEKPLFKLLVILLVIVFAIFIAFSF